MKEEKEQVHREREQKQDFGIDLKKMTEAGLQIGHKTSKTHPKMKPYIESEKGGIHLINLEKTKEMLEDALNFIKKTISGNKVLLLVGTKVQTKSMLKEFAKEMGLPYVSERWLGGTFTNFETLKKRVNYFKSLEKKKEAGELQKYTKKERAKIDKELRDLEVKFGGLKDLEKIPDAVLVLDMKKDLLAIKESLVKGIPVIAISHTNTDPTLIDYPIPANDDAIPAVRYILEIVKEVVSKSKSEIIN